MLVTEKIYILSDLVLRYLHGLPDGTEITTEEALQKVCAAADIAVYAGWDLYEWHELHCAVWDRAKRKGLALDDSKYADQCVGLLHHIPYVITHKNLPLEGKGDRRMAVDEVFTKRPLRGTPHQSSCG